MSLNSPPSMDQSLRLARWLASTAGVVAVLVAATLLLIPIGAATILLVFGLTFGIDKADKFPVEWYWIGPVMASVIVLVAAVRRASRMLGFSRVNSVIAAPMELFKRFFTSYLALQLSAGFIVATTIVAAANEANPKTDTLHSLIVSLFSVFVFIVSTTFISFFMRELIPWRKEHPNFSNAIAYTLSILLGLIAGIFALAETTRTLADATTLGATLYRASVMFATIGATVVGAYIALIKNRIPTNRSAETGGPTPAD